MGPLGFLPNVVQLTISFLYDLRGRMKQTFQKIAVCTMTKDFGPIFLVPSSVTNLEKQFTRAHKLFQRLLWKLYVNCFRTWRLLKTKIFEKLWQTFQ